jgi:hypothetical protein
MSCAERGTCAPMNNRLVGAVAVAASIMMTVGCSTQNDSPSESPSTSSDYLVSLSVPAFAALPKCTANIANDIAFVDSPPGLWDCLAGHWLSIPCTPIQSGQVAYSNQTQTLIACVEGTLMHPLEYACSIHAVHDSTVREFRRAA